MWALAGLFICIRQPNDARVFLLVYSLTSLYFAGVMVRLMLVLAPALVLLAAVAMSHTLTLFSEMAQVCLYFTSYVLYLYCICIVFVLYLYCFV